MSELPPVSILDALIYIIFILCAEIIILAVLLALYILMDSIINSKKEKDITKSNKD